MKKVLGISASPRKNGNSEIIIKEISSQIPEDHELEIIRLHDYKINHCNACYKCISGSDSCVIDDGLAPVLNAMSKADAYIIAVPTYFLGPNSSLKALLDRGLSFYNLAEKLWKKPAIGIAISGIKNKDGYTKLGIENFLNILMCDIKGLETLTAAYPAEIVINTHNLTKAKELGNALFGKAIEDISPTCNLCGSSNFQFIENDKIKCLCCSNVGTIKFQNGRIILDIQIDDHPLFLSEDMAMEHKNWLIEMKNKFKSDIPKLKKIRDKYS